MVGKKQSVKIVNPSINTYFCLQCRKSSLNYALASFSNMTRDNPYVPRPPGGSNLNGIDGARLLKDLEERLIVGLAVH